MRDRLIKFLATGFGVGYMPVAPGMAGSFVGVGYWWLIRDIDSAWLYGLICVAGIGFAIWCSGAAARLIGSKDPSIVVIDELVVIPVAMIGLGATWWEVVVVFGFFRIFDVLKPGVVAGLQRLPEGWGIVADDVLAALYACLAGHAARWLVSTAATG